MVFSEVLFVTHKVVAVLGFFLFFVAVLVLCDLYRKRHVLKFARNYKGFPFYPVIGNTYHLLGKDLFTAVEHVKKNFGLPCNLWNGHDYHYITSDVAEVRVILNNPNTFDKGTLYNSFKTMFDSTLLLAKFEDWKRNRKIFSKSFSQPILNGFVDVFYDKACIVVEMLKDSHSEDIYDIFSRLSMDNFCANVMGLDLNGQTDLDNKLVPLIKRAQHMVEKRVFASYFIPEIIYILFTADGRSTWKDVLEIRNMIYEIIKKKRTIFTKETECMENNNKLPLMDLMLESEGSTFTDEEIFREILLFLLAAIDTSGNTLAHIFTLLGMNPSVQERVYEEIKETVGLTGPISHHHLPNLKYTEKAIFEAMRILPATPLLERYATGDVDLGDKTIPAGANIMINVYDLHRNQAHWKNPLEFNPDRFTPEEIAQRDPYCYMPFSNGPRNCIGMKYALMMMKITVAHVVRNFEITSKCKSVEDMKFTSLITMKTVHRLDCTFTPRKHE